jgi:hypothetical protein
MVKRLEGDGANQRDVVRERGSVPSWSAPPPSLLATQAKRKRRKRKAERQVLKRQQEAAARKAAEVEPLLRPGADAGARTGFSVADYYCRKRDGSKY